MSFLCSALKYSTRQITQKVMESLKRYINQKPHISFHFVFTWSTPRGKYLQRLRSSLNLIFIKQLHSSFLMPTSYQWSSKNYMRHFILYYHGVLYEANQLKERGVLGTCYFQLRQQLYRQPCWSVGWMVCVYLISSPNCTISTVSVVCQYHSRL